VFGGFGLAGTVTAAALTGSAMGYLATNQSWLLLAEIVVAVLGLVFVLRWRWGVYAILLYLPVAGLVANLLYPAPAAVLLSDGLIGATYLGFAGALSRRQEHWLIPPPLTVTLLLLCGVCVVESFNPGVPGPLVAVVGFRVVLFYIPLLVLGISLAERSPLLLDRLVWFVLISSVPVCLFGIWEWFQGPAAVADLSPALARTVWVVGPEATTSLIFRPASTFGFVGQFSGYLFFVTLVAYGAIHAARRAQTLGLLAAIFGAAVVSVILSGGRTIWLQLPVAAFAMYLVMRGRPSRFPWSLPLIVVTLVIAFAIGQPILDNRLPILASPGYLRAHADNVSPFRPELFSLDGLVGHGTGSALGATRYVNGGDVPGQFESGWYVPLYMFGLMGLVAYVLLYTVVLRLAWIGLRSMTHDRRWVGAAIFCYLLIVASVEGAINYPPANVLFWLFAGLLAGQAMRPRPDTAGALAPAGMKATSAEDSGSSLAPGAYLPASTIHR
jgi:hypothetical protein